MKVRNLPRKAAVGAVGLVAAGGLALGLTMAGVGSASVGADPTTQEQAGLFLTHAQFEKVVANVYLRKSGQYSPEVTSFGDSVQLLTATRQITLGISATTGSGGSAYSPGLAVFDRGGTAPSDLLASGNSGFGSFSVPSGNVRLSLYYSKATGVVHATVLDVATGQAASSSYDLGLGAKIVEARVGNEVGCYGDQDPRVVSGCGSEVTAPAADTKLAAFSGIEVQNYLNKDFTNVTGSYFFAAPIGATDNGSGTGRTLISPGTLGASSFTDYFRA